MTRSTSPRPTRSTISFCSFGERNRLSISIRTGKSASRSREGDEVLLREHRRRDEHRDLLPVLDRLERGADRDLGLPVTDVAADEPIHRPRRFHVALDVLDRLELIGRLLVDERRLELALPGRVGRERVSRARLPCRVDAKEILRHLLDGAARPRLHPLPRRAAEARDRRRAPFLGRVALHHAELVDRHEESIVRCVVDLDAFGVLAVEREPLEPAIDADPVVQVDDEVARLQREEVAHGRGGGARAPGAAAPIAREDLVVGEDGELRTGENEAGDDRADLDRGECPARELLQPFRLAAVVADDDPLVCPGPRAGCSSPRRTSSFRPNAGCGRASIEIARRRRRGGRASRSPRPARWRGAGPRRGRVGRRARRAAGDAAHARARPARGAPPRAPLESSSRSIAPGSSSQSAPAGRMVEEGGERHAQDAGPASRSRRSRSLPRPGRGGGGRPGPKGRTPRRRDGAARSRSSA